MSETALYDMNRLQAKCTIRSGLSCARQQPAPLSRVCLEASIWILYTAVHGQHTYISGYCDIVPVSHFSTCTNIYTYHSFCGKIVYTDLTRRAMCKENPRSPWPTDRHHSSWLPFDNFLAFFFWLFFDGLLRPAFSSNTDHGIISLV